jgi:hypothetical protein
VKPLAIVPAAATASPLFGHPSSNLLLILPSLLVLNWVEVRQHVSPSIHNFSGLALQMYNMTELMEAASSLTHNLSLKLPTDSEKELWWKRGTHGIQYLLYGMGSKINYARQLYKDQLINEIFLERGMTVQELQRTVWPTVERTVLLCPQLEERSAAFIQALLSLPFTVKNEGSTLVIVATVEKLTSWLKMPNLENFVYVEVDY